MRTKKGMKFYHSFDKCDDDDPAAQRMFLSSFFFMILSNLVKIAQKYIFGPLVYHNLAFFYKMTQWQPCCRAAFLAAIFSLIFRPLRP